MADRGLAAFGRGGADILERKTSELGQFLLDRDRMTEKRGLLEADPATQLTKIKLGEERARVEKEKTPVSWTEFEGGLIGYAPRTQKMLTDLVKNLGIFDETGMTTAGDMNRAMTRLMGKPGTLLAIAKSETGHYQDIYNDAKYTYEELKKNNKADTPQGRKALDILNSATQDLSNISKAASALITKSTEYEREEEKAKTEREQELADADRKRTEALELMRERAKEARITAAAKPPPAKAAQNWLLGNDESVISYDGGRTYIDKDGKNQPMPSDATKISVTMTGTERELGRARERALAMIKTAPTITRAIAIEEVAKGGTGPYSKLAAAFDAIAGGLGVKELFGGKGSFFPETQKNRQALRTIKQLGKAALLLSTRGATYEQKILDKLFPDPDKMWTNPETEALKFNELRITLSQVRTFNNEAIAQSSSVTEIRKLEESNIKLNRLLALLGGGALTENIPTINSQEEYDALSSGDIYFEDGKKYRKP